jgi:hypothetical protein
MRIGRGRSGGASASAASSAAGHTVTTPRSRRQAARDLEAGHVTAALAELAVDEPDVAAAVVGDRKLGREREHDGRAVAGDDRVVERDEVGEGRELPGREHAAVGDVDGARP